MNHQSKCIPMEIFGLIVAESSDEVLKNIRLTCRAGREIATPLLFQCFRVQAINHHTITRLREMSRRPQLASLVRRFEYQPRIRRSSHNNVERRQLREQNDLLHTSGLVVRDLVTALKSFTQLRHVELQYPPFGMRRENNRRGLRVLADVIRNIYSNVCPRLISLNIVGLLLIDVPLNLVLIDVPLNLVQDAGDGMGAALTTVERLDLDFHPGDMPSGEMARIEPDGLRRLLSLVTNLTSLRVGFRLLEKSMRSFDWSALQCTKLKTLELVQLEMSGTSLMNIILRNAHSIRQVILESVHLLDGTWAAIYDGVANAEGINDISEIHGRRYADDCDSIDTELGAASYRRLFAVVEKRRENQGLPSMRWPISATGFVYHRDFSYMESG